MSETREQETRSQKRVYSLSLFPLRLVMFPGQLLPLHVFEPRYRMMIDRCIDEREPFGVVLMREDIPDWRAFSGKVALPHEVGTAAYIRQVERLPDGRMNIITVGIDRFVVRRLMFDMPYLRAEVEDFPLQDSNRPGAQALTGQLRRLLSDYVRQLAQIVDEEIDASDLPDNAHELAFLAASTLQIPLLSKQSLLATPDLTRLAASEFELLGRETMFLSFMHASEKRIDDQTFGATGMLYPN
jgi:Lon protease-like protein